MALGIEKATAANALKKTVRIFSKRKQKNRKTEKKKKKAILQDGMRAGQKEAE